MIDLVVKDLYDSQSSIMRKAFATFCTQAAKVLSFKCCKEHFLEPYSHLSEDKLVDVKVHFLNSIVDVRPYLELDIDLILKFNNNLTLLRIDENRKISDTALEVDMKLLKLKDTKKVTEKIEKDKLDFEDA